MTHGLEREYKFAVGFDFVLPTFDDLGIATVDRGVVDIDAVYWDTADHQLLGQQVGVRHRIGDSWTFKGPSRTENGAVVREELIWPDSEQMPQELNVRLVALVSPAEFVPVVQMHTRRHRFDIHNEATGSAIAEVDDDAVDVLDGSRSVMRFREVELEVVGTPDPELLNQLVERVRQAGAKPHTTPKLIRALRALDRG